MRRRDFVAGLGGVAAWPLVAQGQQSRLVALLMNGNSNEPALQAYVAAFTRGLRDLGWVEDKNLRIAVRWKRW